jgi:hypothetical protein
MAPIVVVRIVAGIRALGALPNAAMPKIGRIHEWKSKV